MKLKNGLGLICCVLMLLSGCVTNKPGTEPEPVAVEPAREKPISQQQMIASLLAKAEKDLAADRLMWPRGRNAYEKFGAVLHLQPGHAQALTGMQQILIRYVELGRQALGKNKLSSARTFLAQAKRIDSANPLIKELQASIAQAESQPSTVADQEFAMNPRELSARAESVRQLLRKIATRVATTDESVLIVARNDAEGRWIYGELRQAAPGYRIRGDIRIESSPRILLLPPLD